MRDLNDASACYTDRQIPTWLHCCLEGQRDLNPQSQDLIAISRCPLFFDPGIGRSQFIEIDQFQLFFLELQVRCLNQERRNTPRESLRKMLRSVSRFPLRLEANPSCGGVERWLQR